MTSQQRVVSDARTLRALTHPTRIALIEALALSGPLTATAASEHVGESPSSCSFHLRQLAKYGFVEEAGGGHGRARPWRLSNDGIGITSAPGDSESEIASAALGRLVVDRQLARHETWQTSQGGYPRAWQEAGRDSEWVAWLTAAELETLSAKIAELIEDARAHERHHEPASRPPDALPVEMVLFAYPIAPPPPSASPARDEA